MNVYVGSPKEITKKQTNNKTLLELKSEYKKLEGYKVDVKKVQLLSYIPAMNIWDLKIKTQYIYISVREERCG